MAQITVLINAQGKGEEGCNLNLEGRYCKNHARIIVRILPKIYVDEKYRVIDEFSMQCIFMFDY